MSGEQQDDWKPSISEDPSLCITRFDTVAKRRAYNVVPLDADERREFERTEPEESGCLALWWACLNRAYDDARGVGVASTAGKKCAAGVRIDAYRWFRARSEEVGGWGWMQTILNLSPTQIEEMEREIAQPWKRAA